MNKEYRKKIKELRNIMSESFNHHIDFNSFTDLAFINFTKQFLKGDTEYYKDEYFQQFEEKDVESLLSELKQY